MRSKSQWGYMFAAEKRGELAPGTARRWARHTTTPYSRLPSRLHGFGIEPAAHQDVPLWEAILFTAATAIVSTMVTFWMMEWLEDHRHHGRAS